MSGDLVTQNVVCYPCCGTSLELSIFVYRCKVLGTLDMYKFIFLFIGFSSILCSRVTWPDVSGVV